MTDDKKSDDGASDPQVNPYAPPAAAIAKPRPRRPGGARRSPWVWGYAAGQLAGIGADIAYRTSLVDSNLYGIVLRFGCLILGLAWLGSSYERVPPRLRLEYSPGTFIGRHFWPFYNFYWLFKAQSVLCHALDTLLVESGHRRSAPHGLAIAGCALALVSRMASQLPPGVFVVFALVQAGVWTAYMIGVEETFARAAAPPPRRVCDTCDHANDADALFCTKCGADVAPQNLP